MTTATLPRSAYPAPVAELLPRARELADELGALPSQRRLKAELRIGMDKARAVRAALADEVTDTAGTAGTAGTVPETVTEAPSGISAETPVPVPLVEPAEPVADPAPPGVPAAVVALPLAGQVAGPDPATSGTVEQTGVPPGAVRSWPVLLLALPAFVAIWSGWVGLGG